MPVTWLHISDLHIREGDPYDRDVVLRSLVRSVRRFRERDDRKPDLLFATGDIAYSGRPEEYKIATDFLDQILEAAGLSRRRLYVVPGNHDVDRIVGRQLLRELPSRTAADEYFRPGALWLHLRHKLESFVSWHDRYFNGIRRMPNNSTCGPVEQIRVRGIRLGILPVNTALFCLDDDDHGRLSIGRRCFGDAVENHNLVGADLKIALMHHPLEFISAVENQSIRAGLVDHFDVILSGHLHRPSFAAVGMWTGRNLWCAAGATYQTRDLPNTAYYATFNTDHVTIFPIRYEDQPREVWTVDPSIFPYGRDHLASFPVPCEPGFRSFRILGYDAGGSGRSLSRKKSTNRKRNQ
jgi:predicted phosphodiesterase